MLQELLAEPNWINRMEQRDRQAPTPLIYPHVTPYGTFHLDMRTGLPIQHQSMALVV